MNISGIYKIQSKIKPERIYIGSGLNVPVRWRSHLKDLRRSKHHSKKLQYHYDKYGEADLQFSILLGCEKEDLIKTEQYFIDSYNPYFNICKIAGNCTGRKVSEETRRKISISNLGRKSWHAGLRGVFSQETLEKMRQSHLGKKTSQTTESKEKIRISMMGNKKGEGHKWTEDRREKIKQTRVKNGNGNGHFGIKQSPETTEKIRKANLGQKRTIEARQKMRIAHIGKKYSEETKAKMSLSRMGHITSKETRRKLSISNTKKKI